MAVELVMPKLGLTMTEGLIINWLKAEGEMVQAGEGVLEIETEKLTNIVESPVNGTILKIIGEVGETLPIAAVLAYIGESGEMIAETAGSGARIVESEPGESEIKYESEIKQETVPVISRNDSGRIKASPAARALARSLGIEYTDLAGTGPGGRIIKQDIEDAYSSKRVMIAPSSSKRPRDGSSMPYTGIRKAIGEGMSKSWSIAPMVTHHVKADVTELVSLREQLNDGCKDGDVKVSITDLFAKITAYTIMEFPVMGATLKDNEIHIPGVVNIGVAVALEKGLVVPVIRNADAKTLFEISMESKALITKARNNALGLDDMSGGTFTITNVGGYGSVDYFTPIINQPESAILGIGRAVKEPVVRDEAIVIRFMAGLSLTFDHRVIDGAPAAEFLAALLRHIEKPARILFMD